jgi:hypothetical protein
VVGCAVIRFLDLHACGEQQAQTLAAAWVNLENRNPSHCLDAFQVKAGNNPVVGKAEREVRVTVERNHPAFFLNRIIASFSFLVSALIAASRFNAALRLP